MLDYVASLKVPVIVGPIYETPQDDERFDAVYSLPAELHKRGVKIAFASFDAHNSRNLPYQAGFATGFGFPPTRLGRPSLSTLRKSGESRTR